MYGITQLLNLSLGSLAGGVSPAMLQEPKVHDQMLQEVKFAVSSRNSTRHLDISASVSGIQMNLTTSIITL